MNPTLSIVIPVMNESENVLNLATEIDTAFRSVAYPYEVVWVDDGSTDNTLEELKKIANHTGSRHRFISFEKNYGQSAAFMAGFNEAKGEWVGTLDGDGQNDPSDLIKELEFATAYGLDMVNGVRKKRQDNMVRKISSKIANWVRNKMTNESVTDVGCSTRVAKRNVLIGLPFFHGMHRFLPTLVRSKGYSVGEVPVNHRSRENGKSKYGINNRLWSGMRDLVGVRWLLVRQRVWKIKK
jgi:dolichol-phosphate mannosyltransferase